MVSSMQQILPIVWNTLTESAALYPFSNCVWDDFLLQEYQQYQECQPTKELFRALCRNISSEILFFGILWMIG